MTPIDNNSPIEISPLAIVRGGDPDGKIKTFPVPEAFHAEVKEISKLIGCNLGQTHQALLSYAMSQFDSGAISLAPAPKPLPYVRKCILTVKNG